MKNVFRFMYKYIKDGITGKNILETNNTDVKIVSGTATSSTTGSTTLLSITVSPGEILLIGDVDLIGTGAGTAEITITYTNYLGNSETITRYIGLGAAGEISSQHDFNTPFMALYIPPTGSSATLNYNILETADAYTFYGNIAYTVREL
jgi:hypothetical protein